MNFSFTTRERGVLRSLLAERAEALLSIEREGTRQAQAAPSEAAREASLLMVTSARQEWACVTRILDKIPKM